MHLSLINAEQYFKRKDLKSIPWFAISNNILEHPDFFDITGDEFKAFIWIIGVAAKTKKHEFILDLKHAAHMTKLKESVFKKCIEKLLKKRIQVVDNTEDVTSSSRVRNESVPNITVTKESTYTEQRHDTSEPHQCVHEDLISDFTFPFLIKVQTHVQRGWIETYGDKEFIRQELTKAVTWIYANPSKAPKSNFAKFFSSWLARGWENYRKTLKPEAKVLDASSLPERKSR